MAIRAPAFVFLALAAITPAVVLSQKADARSALREAALSAAPASGGAATRPSTAAAATPPPTATGDSPAPPARPATGYGWGAPKRTNAAPARRAVRRNAIP